MEKLRALKWNHIIEALIMIVIGGVLIFRSNASLVIMARALAVLLVLAGGVSANSFLRATFDKAAKKKGIKLYYPELKYCTDNAAMIASCGYYEYMNGKRDSLDLNAYPSLQM